MDQANSAHESLCGEDWLAGYLSITTKAIQAWRTRGGGPKFIKVGRLVRYRKSDVDAWIESRSRANTSQ